MNRDVEPKGTKALGERAVFEENDERVDMARKEAKEQSKTFLGSASVATLLIDIGYSQYRKPNASEKLISIDSHKATESPVVLKKAVERTRHMAQISSKGYALRRHCSSTNVRPR